MTLRELTRCIAWALALGALALFPAMFTTAGLAQAEGPWAWLVLAAEGWREAVAMPVAFAAQFAYFFGLVWIARRAWQRHLRRR